ncbi:MAG: hypothetical protein WBA74_05585 [Cyclobacteriaceae bacterium]
MRIFENWNFARIGLLFYLNGFIISVLHYATLGIFTTAVLKPHLIIIGILCFAYFTFPQIIMVVTTKVSASLGKKKQLIVTLSVFLVFALLQHYLFSQLILDTYDLYFAIITTVLQFLYLFRFSFIKFDLYKNIVAYALFVFIFSYYHFPRLPSVYGGAKPLKIVSIDTSPKGLLKSRFQSHPYLLFESENDYYFIEYRKANGIVLDQKVHMINKKSVLKLTYYVEPSWID